MTPLVKAVIEELEKTRWAALFLDPDYTVVWVSEEMKNLVDEHDPERLGIGRHIVEAWMSETWLSVITPQSLYESFLTQLPYVMTSIPKEEIKKMLGPELAPLIDDLEPAEALPIQVNEFEYVAEGFKPTKVRGMNLRVYDDDGVLLGVLILYGSALPAHILGLVARGDEGMFMRMANLVQPGRRQAAVLFADLQESGVLSRRLPSAAYFRLIARLTDAIDQVVIDQVGIVGKHAGDGVTAFFLADDLGSASDAAAASIRAARSISEVAATVVKSVIEETDVAEIAELCVNVGVHWGGTLYMGQLVTGGRLEITALGDNVNECARIQETARDGQVLVSKNLIEHLSDKDSAELRLEVDTLVYRTLAELPSASPKAKRDAGTVPVTVL